VVVVANRRTEYPAAAPVYVSNRPSNTGGVPPPPVPVPVPPLIALSIPIWIGISPHSYDASRRSRGSEDPNYLQREERASSSARQSNVVAASGAHLDVATRPAIQNAAGVGRVDENSIVLSTSHNVSAKRKSIGVIDIRNRSYASGSSGVIHDVSRRNPVSTEVNSGVHELISSSNAVSSAAKKGTRDTGDIDGVARDNS
tara:strand:- start:2894 stop:3493 length:600 start_codon:yes stop_codon:yes gene_type:complete